MQESTTKEKILKKVRNAIIHKSDNPYPGADLEKMLYNEPAENQDVSFATAFSNMGGNFIYCAGEKDAMAGLKSLVEEKKWENLYVFDKEIQSFLNAAKIPFHSDNRSFNKVQVGVSFCEFLIARFGSIMVSSAQKSGRRMHSFPDVHVVLAFSSQIVPGIKEALMGIKSRYGRKIPSAITMITGPSRTADIEKTLVMGAHGPRELYVFLIDDSIN